MNKSSLIFLGAVAIGFGAVIYWKEQSLSETRRLNAMLQQGSAALSAQAERDRAEIDRLRKEIDVFKDESEQLRKSLEQGRTVSGPGPDGAADRPTPEDSGRPAQFVKGLEKMFTDPEMKKTMRMQQMVGIRMLYGDLVQDLGLIGADAEQILEILGDRQMALSTAALANLDPNAAESESRAKKLGDTREHYTEHLKAVLGPGRYEKFQRYERSIGDRFMLQQSEGQFAAVGAPLAAAQKEKLLALMMEERSKAPSSGGNLANTADPQKQLQALQSDEAIGQFATWQETINGRVLDRARAILNADQIATLRNVQAQQIELLKSQAKMSRELLGGGK